MIETYLIAITPPASIQKRVREEQQKYPKFSVYHLPPHITLYHPFESSITLQELTSRLKKNLGDTTPQSINCNAYGVFEGKQGVLYFQPDPTSIKLLTKLHNRTKRSIPKTHREVDTPYKTYGRYNPHLTIAERIPRRALTRIKERLEAPSKPLSFMCSRIDIYQRNPKSHTYTKVRHVQLTASKRNA